MNTPEPFSLITFPPDQIVPGARLDAYLAGAMNRSRTHVQGLIRQSCVKIHPARSRLEAGSRLRVGDEISVQIVPDQAPTVLPVGEDIPLEILHEDDFLLVVNKQSGLVVHPAAGHASGTLVNALVHHCGEHLAQRGGGNRLGIVHRLDKDTSGVLLVAKTDLAHERLAQQFADRTTKKIYHALVWGVLRKISGECRGAIGRHPVQRKKMAVQKNPEKGRSAYTEYRLLKQSAQGAEVSCILHTGRTHQIRVHLADLGHPVWGDILYGKTHSVADDYRPSHQMLHASSLEIQHPLTGLRLNFSAPFPEDYQEARKRLLKD